MPVTSVYDVKEGFRGDTVDDTFLEELIRKAERKLARRLAPVTGDLTDWATTEIRISAVKDVVSDMIHRILRSGGSPFKSESDGGYSYTIDPTAAAANLWVTAENWRDLVGDGGSSIGTIRTTIPEWSGKRTF